MNYICDRCGAHLDPGERCDCWETEYAAFMAKQETKKAVERLSGASFTQLEFDFLKEGEAS